MQWFLFGRRWILFYFLLLIFVFLISLELKLLNYEFHFKLLYMVFFWIVFIINFLPTLFFSLMGLFLPKRLTNLSISQKPIDFLVIIPAYNENQVILNSVNSLLKQQNGRNYQSRIVVAFNGTDETGNIAQQYGAEVITTPEPKCGKSKAIAYVLSQISLNPHRYVIIVDADNVVADDFLRQTAIACQSGKLAYQCNHQPLLASQNWVSKGLQAGYCASSRLFNTGRSRLMDSALLCGTGMVIREDVIRHLWNRIKTQTEDIELNGLLSIHYNAGVEWIDEAVFYDEKPDVIDVAIRQRVRWMVGHARCFYFYSVPLFKHFLKTGNVRAMELILYYLMPLSLLISTLWLLLMIPIAMLGYYYDVKSYQDILYVLTIIFLLYILILPILGYFLQMSEIPVYKRIAQSLIYSLYSMIFAMCVWPIAMLFACISLTSTTWIFHTPHKVKALT